MAFEIVDPSELLTDGVFFEDRFLDSVARHDWDRYAGKVVLVRGCASAVIPPWAYMLITARLAPRARSIRFGNEHDNIVVYRTGK